MITNGGITIYHKTYNHETRLDEWTRTPIFFANWHGKQAVNVSDKGLDTASIFSVRIPTTSAINIANGDIVARGILSEDISSPSQILSKYPQSFVATAVSDARRGGLPHFRIEGK
ncbi:MAG: DUF6751 family protein [Oscillospiraceae bacterium]